jgi:putative DNA primase/helicase
VNGWRDDGARPTPEELEAARRESAKRAAKEKAERARKHAKAASKASALWEAAKPAPSDNPYLSCKGVSPVATLREVPADESAVVLGYAPKSRGEPLTGRLLVVPVQG